MNNTLRIIGKYPTGLCEHCQVPETVEHVLVAGQEQDYRAHWSVVEVDKAEDLWSVS